MDIVDIAERATLIGGRVVLRADVTGASDLKGAGDYVTAVDRESERAIFTFLRAETGLPVVGEESGGDARGRYWLVDPLDGTTNFLHRFPAVGVSVALVQDGEPIVGAVHAPFLGLTWSGARGEGANVRRDDGKSARLSVSERPVDQAIVGTGFPFRHKHRFPRYLEVFRGAFERFEDLRRPGAASLDLAWVAEGVLEGFFELGLAPWDVAAGALLIQEAGGVVSDWTGGPGWLEGDILAGSQAVHGELLRLAAPER